MVKKTSSSNDRQVLLLISFGHSSCIGTQIADDIYCGRTNGIANRQINVKSDKQNTKIPIQWLPETVEQSENWLFKCFLMTLNAITEFELRPKNMSRSAELYEPKLYFCFTVLVSGCCKPWFERFFFIFFFKYDDIMSLVLQ